MVTTLQQNGSAFFLNNASVYQLNIQIVVLYIFYREDDKAIIQHCQRNGVSKETFSALAKQLNKLPNVVSLLVCCIPR